MLTLIVDEFIGSFKQNNLQYCDSLIKSGVVNINVTSINHTVSQKMTVLSSACFMDRQDLFDWAISRGADVNLTNPLIYAVKVRNKYMVDKLLFLGADGTKMFSNIQPENIVFLIPYFLENRDTFIGIALDEVRETGRVTEFAKKMSRFIMHCNGIVEIPDRAPNERWLDKGVRLYDWLDGEEIVWFIKKLHAIPKQEKEIIKKLYDMKK